MDANRFEAVAKLFAERRVSRRLALARASAGLAAGGLAAGLSARITDAQNATPAAATPETTSTGEFGGAQGPSTLFVQSFQKGAIAAKASGTAGEYTLTLEQGLGQTIYFSDRPDRIVGATPTPDFLQQIGFPDDNPPNAALIVTPAPDHTDIAVVELFNPRYDDSTNTATYDVTLQKQWENTLDIGFTEQPTSLADLHPTFGAAHLFIDDCPGGVMQCITDVNDPINSLKGTIPNDDHGGFCYNWGAAGCYPCQPWFTGYSGDQEAYQYWSDQCNQRFATCEGKCGIREVCSEGVSSRCTRTF